MATTGALAIRSDLKRFSMARAADPQGARTVGIITKCDALEPGDEDGVRLSSLVGASCRLTGHAGAQNC